MRPLEKWQEKHYELQMPCVLIITRRKNWNIRLSIKEQRHINILDVCSLVVTDSLCLSQSHFKPSQSGIPTETVHLSKCNNLPYGASCSLSDSWYNCNAEQWPRKSGNRLVSQCWHRTHQYVVKRDTTGVRSVSQCISKFYWGAIRSMAAGYFTGTFCNVM